MLTLANIIVATASVAVLVANVILSLALVIGRWGRPRRPEPAPAAPRSLTLIRPMKGAAPGAAASNRSLVEQRWEGEISFAFVASDAEDPGLVLARERLGDDPRVRCMSAPARADATDKASNMMRAWRATGSELVAFCDADITLPPGLLARTAAAFAEPEVVAVFAPVIYRPATLPQRLAGLLTSGDKLAIVRTLDRWRRLDLMEGGLMMVRRSAVEALGPIEELLANTVADDLRLATALARAGGVIRATDPIVHPQRASSLRGWAHQYHRWMVCQRVENPQILAIQLLLHPIVLPIVALALSGGSPFAAGLLALSVGWRVALTAATDRLLLRPYGLRFGWWALARPLADLAHFAFCASAFVSPRVTWAGRTYRFRTRPPVIARNALAAKAPESGA